MSGIEGSKPSEVEMGFAASGTEKAYSEEEKKKVQQELYDAHLDNYTASAATSLVRTALTESKSEHQEVLAEIERVKQYLAGLEGRVPEVENNINTLEELLPELNDRYRETNEKVKTLQATIPLGVGLDFEQYIYLRDGGGIRAAKKEYPEIAAYVDTRRQLRAEYEQSK